MHYNGVVVARLIGRYQVVRLLGSGGFATVYLARDAVLDADVAVKVLAENWAANADITRRFVEEARLLRLCDGDHIVRVHTIEELDDGRPYFVMEHADGGSLADRLRATGRLGLDEALAVSADIATGLTVVHDHGIVHRDLKPSNVLFRRGHAVLGDFGMARDMVIAGDQTIYGGTPSYTAPEQADPARAAQVDARADIYAAAVVLYETVVGRPPFAYASLAEAARRRLPPPLLADVPAPLADAVARGLAFDPAERHPTARAWQRAISSAPDQRTVVMAPTPARRRPRRRGWIAAALVAAAVVGALLLAARRPGPIKPDVGAATTTVEPTSTAAPSTIPAAPGVDSWFAAASGPGCIQQVPRPPVLDEVACAQAGVEAVFRELSSPVDVPTFLRDVVDQHPDATQDQWAEGERVRYRVGTQTVLVWTYRGTPYVGQATGTDSRVTSWWETTGRAVIGQTTVTTAAPARKKHGDGQG